MDAAFLWMDSSAPSPKEKSIYGLTHRWSQKRRVLKKSQYMAFLWMESNAPSPKEKSIYGLTVDGLKYA